MSDAVPETIEASLQLSEAALIGFGVATGPVIASIHKERDKIRAELQKACTAAGLPTTHAIRAKTQSLVASPSGMLAGVCDRASDHLR